MGFWKLIFKNTSWLFFGQAFSLIVAALYTFFLARVLSPSGFGRYSYALSFFGLVTVISDFGFNYFIMREVSKKPEIVDKLGGIVISLRLILAVFVYAIFSIFLFAVDNNLNRVLITLIMVVSILPNSIAITLDALLKARNEMKESSLAFSMFRLTVALSGVLAVLLGFSLWGVVVTFFASHLIYDLVLLRFLSKKGIKLSLSFSLAEVKRIARLAMPYAVLMVLGFVYFNFDRPLLTLLRSEKETGYYAASYKFLDMFLAFVPSVFLTSLFPHLSRFHEESKELLKSTYFKAMGILFIASLPISIVLYFFAPVIIQIVYRQEYLESVNLLKILSLTLPFIALHTPGATLLFSSDKYLKQVIFISLFTTGFNLMANLVFIPIYGAYAAAVITVVSEAISFIVFFTFITKKVFATSKMEIQLK